MLQMLPAEHLVDADHELEVSIDASSFNHAYLQARLVILLGRFEQYTPVSELSLDIELN